ncbi:MAG: hypothetical protein N2234_01230 [Planctomycetota bacterium]|nr:hypothetical protein [Planctomycetota bacterium]
MRFLMVMVVLLCMGVVLAQQPPKQPAEPPKEQPKEEGVPVRAELKDGNLVVGTVMVDKFEIETAYGKLVVPSSEIRKIVVGKAADKELVERIKKLVAQLGVEEFKDRKQAMDELLKLGRLALSDLKAALKSEDAEVKKNAESLIAEIEQQFPPGGEEEVIDDDEVVTNRFTIRGTILQDEFSFKTKYGELKVKKKDVKRMFLGGGYVTEKRFEVGGSNVGTTAMLDTGIEITAGMKIVLKATGEIFVRNWSMSCGPEGNSSYGQHVPGIPMGALMGRIGASGEVFKIGNELKITAKTSGKLYLGIAIQERFQVTGNFSVSVKAEK